MNSKQKLRDSKAKVKITMNKKISFAGRKKARCYALQALYGWMLSENPLTDIEKHVLSDHEKEDFDREYFHILLHKVPEKVTELESIMRPYLSRKLEEVGPIELTILRISVYELKELPAIPYKVIINEALELAKKFGSSDSHKFINGILDKVTKEIRSAEMQYQV